MSNVSKLVIKGCSDNKFCSFTGEFITSINPENLRIQGAVSYNTAQGMANLNSLKYRGSLPKLFSFTLLFDNTGIIPGSNTISIMEQIKQLQDVAYNIHTKNNAPNYIRIIWGQIDFKGRLVDLDIVYSMFQVDGTLIRAEASISVLEELVPLGKGKSLAGVDSEYAKPSGANATSKKMAASGKILASQDAFAPTPDGMNGPYSGAPPGAYDGAPDQVYHGSNDAGAPVYASSTVGSRPSTTTVPNKPTSNQTGYDSGYESSPSTGSSADSSTAMNGSANQLQGGIAGNGPGGSGGGVGGGGHEPGSNTRKSGNNTASSGAAAGGTSRQANSSKQGAASGPAGSVKSNMAPSPTAAVANGRDGIAKASSNLAAGAAGAAAIASAAAIGANSLRDLKANGKILTILSRLKKIAKRVARRAYDAGKKAVK